MKIIASTNDGYLCEMSRREAHTILNKVSPSIGDEYDLLKAFETLAALRGLSRSQMVYIADNIEKFQKRFGEIQEAYDKLMLIDTIRNSSEKDDANT